MLQGELPRLYCMVPPLAAPAVTSACWLPLYFKFSTAAGAVVTWAGVLLTRVMSCSLAPEVPGVEVVAFSLKVVPEVAGLSTFRVALPGIEVSSSATPVTVAGTSAQ